jgi:hypothetical protein
MGCLSFPATRPAANLTGRCQSLRRLVRINPSYLVIRSYLLKRQIIQSRHVQSRPRPHHPPQAPIGMPGARYHYSFPPSSARLAYHDPFPPSSAPLPEAETTLQVSDALVKSGIAHGGLITDMNAYSLRDEGMRIAGPAFTVKVGRMMGWGCRGSETGIGTDRESKPEQWGR